MPVETCLKLPVNFAQREEVRRFILALREDGIDPHLGHYLALMVVFEFAGQEREFRAADDGFGQMLAEFSHWPAISQLPHGVLLQRLLEAGLLREALQDERQVVTCPLFNQWNPHLLPGFESMHQKGARIAHTKRQQVQDRDTADAHLTMFQRQGVLNLGELDPDMTKDEITAALCFIMRVDRAGGCSTRPSSGYEVWMIATASRFLRTSLVKDVDVLCDFLLAARIDPTVPKGAEVVLPQLEQLLERAKA
jgi:hypothetical protein